MNFISILYISIPVIDKPLIFKLNFLISNNRTANFSKIYIYIIRVKI